jgi:TonB family protein
MTIFMIAALVASRLPSDTVVRRASPVAAPQTIDLRHIVFVAPDRQIGRGGGGGGSQKPGPIRLAQGVGSDAFTLRVRKSPPSISVSSSPAAVPDVSAFPSIVLDAKPLASGDFEQLGLPTGGVLSAMSTGSGSGGGVGTGIGTGIGSGRGPGIGPGSGGGVGGGVYRAGGAVSPPRVIAEVKPNYTSAALMQRIQGTVVLELVVTRDGCASQIRVIRSLDPGGLDQEAVTATAQWRFEPGRLAGVPVDVLVNVMLDFMIR